MPKDEFARYLNEQMINKYENAGVIQMNDPEFQMVAVIDVIQLAQLARKQASALEVIVQTEHIQSYLREHDPKALEQCFDALGIKETIDA